MELFEVICNLIILVGGVLIAIKTISEWIGKPIRFAKKRTDEIFEERVTGIVNKMLPQALYEHDLKVRDTYKADRERYLQEIKEEVLKNIECELTVVDKLVQQYEIMSITAKDVLREKIMQIYFKGLPTRTLTRHDCEVLKQYYKDYKAMKGNSYIDKYYGRMMGTADFKGWEVVEDDYDEQSAL